MQQPSSWSGPRILVTAGFASLAGAPIGAAVGTIWVLVEQLQLPSGPSLTLVPYAALFGALIGTIVAAAAAAAAGVAVFVVPRPRFSGRTRIVAAGAGSAIGSGVLSGVLFLRDSVVGGPFIVACTVLTAAIIAAVTVSRAERTAG